MNVRDGILTGLRQAIAYNQKGQGSRVEKVSIDTAIKADQNTRSEEAMERSN